MSAFPFVGGSYPARSPNFDAQRTINLYPEKSDSGTSKTGAMLVGAPGLKLWTTLPTFGVRGEMRLSSTLSIVVAGAGVYTVSSAKVVTRIGSISPGLTPVAMASNGTSIMLVTGLTGYFIDLTAFTVTPITDAGFQGADIVDVIDGFFVWNTPGTEQIQISGLFATTIDPLDFASVEGGPGNLVSLIVDHTELWLFKEGSARVFFNAGNPDFPLEPIQGAYIEQGCAAKYSVCKLDNTVVWLTADERGQGTVQKAVGYTPQRISTHAMEFALASYSRIDDAVGFSYQQEGHLFYVLTFPTANATWAYDTATELWCERAYRDPISGQLGRHRSNCHMAFAGLNIVGDWQNGNLYSLDLNTFTDNGAILPAIRTCPHIAQGNAWQFFAKLWIDMQTGVGSVLCPNPQLMLEWSDDGGVSFPNQMTVFIGAIGQRQARANFRRLGKSRDRVWRVTLTDPVKRIFIGGDVAFTVGA
jgi:hypothetical protein